MILSDTGNSKFGQCFPCNLTYQLNSISLGSFLRFYRGLFEVLQRGLRLEEVWLEFYIWGGCQKFKKKKNLAT